MVLVPPHDGHVEAAGSIKRSYKFEFKKGDNFADLIKWSGGFSDNAYPSTAILTRSNSIGDISTLKKFDLDLSKNLNEQLRNNDSLIVPAVGVAQREYVSATGALNRAGKYGWYSGMRVSDILASDEDYLVDFTNDTDFEIAIIKRFNQKTKNYSVLAFSLAEVLSNKKSKSNLLLDEFDEIYFLPKNLIDRFLLLEPFNEELEVNSSNGNPLNLITINGDVKSPGTYPLPLKGSLEMAIRLAGGPSDTAFLDSIEVSRASVVEGEQIFQIFEIFAGESSTEASDFLLSSRDRITIRSNESLVLQKTFEIAGYVNFPGSYPLSSAESLSTVIRRAGGLKSNAFSMGAILTRESVTKSRTEQNKILATSIRSSYASSLLTAENRNQDIEDIEAVANIIENLPGNGRLVIDLEQAMNGNDRADIKIEDGDVLYIPQQTNIVNIIGEVRSPNVVNYEKNLRTNDYINLAGGFNQRADFSNIYILRANGSIIMLEKSYFSFGLSRPRFLPGDTLVVPLKQNYQSPLPLWSQVTQIIYQSMVSLAAVKAL